MKRSTDRILVTHAGSLPRPGNVIKMLDAKEKGQSYDHAAFERAVKEATDDIVKKQVELGVDVVDDGEQGKPGFVTYINERLGGFAVDREYKPRSAWANSREAKAFPEYYAEHLTASSAVHLVCTGPVTYKGHAELERDLANLKAAIAGAKGATIEEAFVPAISPANVEQWHRNAFYETQEEYLFAVADALHEEYKAIVDAGFLVQIDDPRLVTYYLVSPAASIEDCRKWAEVRVEALNHALRGIPEDKVRFHTCYGINIGPRLHDMALKDIVDIILRINAGAYSLEAANPRHEHEWKVWKTAKLPQGKVLIPGVITHSTVLVEHPELVAERIVKYAKVVGRENVIAGTDCGFATFAGAKEIHPSIVWEKFKAMRDGARIATRMLWGR